MSTVIKRKSMALLALLGLGAALAACAVETVAYQPRPRGYYVAEPAPYYYAPPPPRRGYYGRPGYWR